MDRTFYKEVAKTSSNVKKGNTENEYVWIVLPVAEMGLRKWPGISHATSQMCALLGHIKNFQVII